MHYVVCNTQNRVILRYNPLFKPRITDHIIIHALYLLLRLLRNHTRVFTPCVTVV